MKRLLSKEFRLAVHPTAFIFLGLSALLIIPNYPYYVTFFYTSLAIFFTCLSGRENKDIAFCINLPVRKRSIVGARFLTVIILQVAQVLLAIPFAILRQAMPIPNNQVGIEANIAFFGLAFLMMGLFNLVFFTLYYRDVRKVGISFVIASSLMFVYIGIVETFAHILPIFTERLDTLDPAFILEKTIVLGAGLIGYVLLSFISYLKAVKLFEQQDIRD